MDVDVIVIGSGPGGYHAALRAAQLGAKTAIVERGDVGGVCLNVGCIPTKALLHVAEELRGAKHAEEFGVTFGSPAVDLERLATWKGSVVSKMTRGVSTLLSTNGVESIRGTARFTGPHALTVDDRTITFQHAIVATGSSPIVIPGFEPDGGRIVDSTGALSLDEVPKRFMAIGGSAIGLEFADIHHAFGSETTVVEFMPEIVPSADVDVAKVLRKSFEKRGVRIMTSTKAVSQVTHDGGIDVTLEREDGSTEVVQVDKLLVAVGRRPNSSDLGLAEIGVDVDARGFVTVKDTMQTSVPHVYAIGDVAGAPLLAHKAMKEGLVAAEHATGHPAAYDTIVPAVIYTSPELASVGMTEAEARAAGFEVVTGTFPLSASGRATALGVHEGLVKWVSEKGSDAILGFHMVGPNAGELVAEATLAIEMGATLEDVALTQHPHPTLAETLMEAAEHAHGRAIHIANRRKR